MAKFGATGTDKALPRAKHFTIESPTNTEDLTLFFTDEALVITKIVAVLNGSSTPSVTWTLRHDADRNATGTEVVTSGSTTTNTTTGHTITSFNAASIPSNSWVWLETTAKSGTVDKIHLSVFYD